MGNYKNVVSSKVMQSNRGNRLHRAKPEVSWANKYASWIWGARIGDTFESITDTSWLQFTILESTWPKVSKYLSRNAELFFWVGWSDGEQVMKTIYTAMPLEQQSRLKKYAREITPLDSLEAARAIKKNLQDINLNPPKGSKRWDCSGKLKTLLHEHRIALLLNRLEATKLTGKGKELAGRIRGDRPLLSDQVRSKGNRNNIETIAAIIEKISGDKRLARVTGAYLRQLDNEKWTFRGTYENFPEAGQDEDLKTEKYQKGNSLPGVYAYSKRLSDDDTDGFSPDRGEPRLPGPIDNKDFEGDN